MALEIQVVRTQPREQRPAPPGGEGIRTSAPWKGCGPPGKRLARNATGGDERGRRNHGAGPPDEVNVVWIFCGGGLGSLARWWVSGWVGRHFGETFPLGTMAVNISGSLVIGLLAGLTGPDGRWLAPPGFREFFLLGLCGGYTTFSSFSLQTLTLVQDGQWMRAGANIVGSVVLCLGAVWAGWVLAGLFNASKGG